MTVSGYVKDEASREALIGASIINADSKSGTTTNQYDFFSLTVAIADTVELLTSYQGYKIRANKITAKKNVRLNMLLENTTGTLGEVIVTTGKNDRNVQKAQMGVIEVPLKAIKNLPVLMGERDLMKLFSYCPAFRAARKVQPVFMYGVVMWPKT